MRVHGPVGKHGVPAQQVVVQVPYLDQEGIVLDHHAMELVRRQYHAKVAIYFNINWYAYF